MADQFKITYSTMSVDNDQLHAEFDPLSGPCYTASGGGMEAAK